MRSVPRPAWLLCLLFLVVGCDNNPFSQVKVSGKLTYDDGSVIPAERIRVWFVSQTPPIDANTHPRPASAQINCEDGTFEGATTYKYMDGLVRGEHKVFIDITPPDAVPPEYTRAKTSPLTVSTAELPLHIKVPKH